MNTEWGLDLDMSAVRLMRWSETRWSEIQVEPIDGPDIGDRLAAMISQIDAGADVMLFLPQDQILCTEVDVTPDGNTQAEIESAMDGRTPYALNEVVLDWERVSPTQAQVAAIARDTLDEAAAFAEVRDLGVAGYSSLGLGDTFPRLPQFAGPNLPSGAVAPDNDAAIGDTGETAVFATARIPSRPPSDPVQKPAADTLILKPDPGTSFAVSDAPVVQVDDATPVMLVKSPQRPLNPGKPGPPRRAAPRVRTDIAVASVSGMAATLTPAAAGGSSVQVHKRGGSVAATALIFAAVFILTIGIATVVWTLLPLAPEPNTQPTAAETGQLEGAPLVDSAQDVPPASLEIEQSNVALLPNVIDEPVIESTVTEEDDLTEAETTPEPPALPQPIVFVGISSINAPAVDTAPALTTHRDAVAFAARPADLSTALQAGNLPAYDGVSPLSPSPELFASILTTAPRLTPLSTQSDTTDDIYFASVENADLASDAIALPSPFGIRADNLPSIGPSPSEPNTGTELAALQPDPVPTQEDLEAAMAAAVSEALVDALAGPGGLIPTKHAATVPDLPPAARPLAFLEMVERNQFGGYTRTELAAFRPPARPISEQQNIAAERSNPPSDLAIGLSRTPRNRPENFAALVTAARVQRDAERLSASVATRTPDTSSAVQAALSPEPQQTVAQARQPNIPTSASVARQATIDNAIRLNKVNLVGVYGASSDRRALVRLPSGRYVKVKVGDRVDGGTVAQITDSELLYRKGNRTLSLSMPQS